MTANEILNQWAAYTHYDDEQTTFDLFSNNYTFHTATKKVKQIMEFDPTGTVAVLYLKKVFLDACKSNSVKLYDVFATPEKLDEDRKMWEIFTSDDVNHAEAQLLDNMNILIEDVVKVKGIGQRDIEAEKESLIKSIETMTEELTGCHEEFYLTSSVCVAPVERFSTHIHVFERLSECVLALESEETKDGMYLCFIRNGNTSDCFFEFMIKSQGNIFGISERVTETFPGQHTHSRNARWSERKKYKLFPYEYIFEYTNHDYLGYSTSQIINDEKLDFFNLGADVYIPLLLAMICLGNKYAGKDISGRDILLFDTLLKNNLEAPSPATTNIIVPQNSAIALRSREYSVPFDSWTIMNGEYGWKHNWPNIPAEERAKGAAHGVFPDPAEENIFERLYGDGFEFDASKVLLTDPHLRLPGNHEKEVANIEFSATKDWFDLLAYQEGRRQFAAHIRKKMLFEFLEFGGTEGIKNWWNNALAENYDKIVGYCIDKYEYLENGGTINTENGWTSNDKNFHSCISMTDGSVHCGHGYHPFNEKKKNERGYNTYDSYLDRETGATCTINFIFNPRDWHELEILFGPLPKPLIGWVTDAISHRYTGNSLLDITDPVSEIGTLFEWKEQVAQGCFYSNDYTKREDSYPAPPANFSFSVSFSKRGFAKARQSRN